MRTDTTLIQAHLESLGSTRIFLGTEAASADRSQPLKEMISTARDKAFVFQLSYNTDCTSFLSYLLQNIRFSPHHPKETQRAAMLDEQYGT
jgi:hypothetical protein